MTLLVCNDKTCFANLSLLWEKLTFLIPRPNSTKKKKKKKKVKEKCYREMSTGDFGFANS